MKAVEVIKQYSRLKYKATDGKFYYLKQIYPIILPVDKSLQNAEEEIFYLDTGDEMTNCDFFQAKITSDKKLLRLADDSSTWIQISSEIQILPAI